MRFFSRQLQAPFFAILLATFVGFAGPAAAIEPIFSDGGAAIRGYDPVSYFTQAKAVEGNTEHTVEHNGVEWRFSSAANRALFAANPERYTPQYGGYCAWAVANNYVAPIDPHAWTIKDDKLYLNYSKLVRTRWALNKSGNIETANGNWPKLRDAN